MKTMTRFAAILLALILLFGGCDVTLEATPTPPPTPTPTPTPEPTVDSDGTVVLPPPDAQYDGPAVVMIEGPEDSAFGLVQENYRADDCTSSVKLGEVVGDTDVLMPTGFRITIDSEMLGMLEFEFDAAFPVAFTADQYTDGEVVSDGGIPAMNKTGYVERYNEDGAWTRTTISQLSTPVPYTRTHLGEALPDTGESDIPTLKDGAVRVNLPLTEPGVYRYTLYFRESIDHTEANMTTGEELYRISMIVIIPISDKVYDLLIASDLTETDYLAEEHPGMQGYGLLTFFRINMEDKWKAASALVYNMTQGGKLDRKVDGEWVEVENAIDKSPPNKYGDRHSGGFVDGNYFLNVSSPPVVFFPELAGEYRLTLIYSNDYDENFDLVLHFNFDE